MDNPVDLDIEETVFKPHTPLPDIEFLNSFNLINKRLMEVGITPIGINTKPYSKLEDLISKLTETDKAYANYLNLKDINFKLTFLKFSMNLIEGK